LQLRQTPPRHVAGNYLLVQVRSTATTTIAAIAARKHGWFGGYDRDKCDRDDHDRDKDRCKYKWGRR
jgi:hypothetical protein